MPVPAPQGRMHASISSLNFRSTKQSQQHNHRDACDTEQHAPEAQQTLQTAAKRSPSRTTSVQRAIILNEHTVQHVSACCHAKCKLCGYDAVVARIQGRGLNMHIECNMRCWRWKKQTTELPGIGALSTSDELSVMVYKCHYLYLAALF